MQLKVVYSIAVLLFELCLIGLVLRNWRISKRYASGRMFVDDPTPVATGLIVLLLASVFITVYLLLFMG